MAPVLHIQGMPIGMLAIMLALVASMGGFMFGYDTGQISDILLMPDFKLRFADCDVDGEVETCAFTTVRSGILVSFLSVGTLIGALLGAPIADYLGRRRAMIAECGIFMVGVIIQVSSTHVWIQYAIGRIVGGLGIGALSAAVPVYQAETAPQQIRGTLTATYQLFITFGILMAYCISIGARELHNSGQWRLVAGMGFTWPLILTLGMLFMPESPRWLASHGRLEEARHAVARARGIEDDDPLITREVEEIRSNVEYESQFRGRWVDCFKVENKTLYRTLLGMALQSFQQLTGANYFFYYGATIFSSVGISDSFITQIILGAVNFICTFGGLYVMERYGRRWPLILGGIWSSVWLFVFGAAGTAKDPTQNKGIGQLMIIAACMFILSFATTWAPGIWIIVGETFAMRTRAKQGALATASNWLWNFLLAFFTPFIVKSIQFRYGFVFAACNMMGSIIVYLFLYESAGLSLEAVEMMYNDPACNAWTSASWAPPGYKSRADLAEHLKAQQQGKAAIKPGDEGKVSIEDHNPHAEKRV